MGRSPCCEQAHTNKGAWTKEEDQRLIAYIKAHGEGCWRSLPKAAGHHHPQQQQQQDHFAGVPSHSPEACSHSSDDEPRSATPPPQQTRHLDIDLNLSISLGPYQPLPEESDNKPLKQVGATTTMTAGNINAMPVCLCLNSLGYRPGVECVCGGASSRQWARSHLQAAPCYRGQ
ncbi:hypothetical protein PR202_ga25136 [Eleusine coracana subsp. coracana]|uniref:Uncharacterized protein n=1 Tax=Eleusine coracana subsp. coracana TaxID=191504 RepID=A0AAV5DAI1_ELECO|nr:hypothetical protein PR202_ga25136 [Eleusine coracana subsp. coracana]